ncbi:alpha-1,2-fucosyltransferase [Polaribacter sp.]|uniref:alpha-1,2-fucosyltransferase n=1 Tax=Polaribacter sp. TaxID=1920175 RepID=UPI003F6C6CDF
MIIVRIVGGLGNQMFQYAYAKALQARGFEVQIDISKFKTYKLHGGYQLDKYKIDLEIPNDFNLILSKLYLKKNLKEKSLLFDENLMQLNGNEYVKGYFQTEKYFLNIRPTLLQQFTLENSFSETTIRYQTEIKNQQNSCAIHIRRGDYISDKKANSIHGTCDLSYYQNAIKHVHNQYKNIHFFVFSDDISWTRNNLRINNATYINHKVIPHEDLYLMSLCKNNITANSSFSWWGAWLNTNEQKMVISPKKWFNQKENEVACKNWIQL